MRKKLEIQFLKAGSICLDINKDKEVKDLYNEQYKTLKIEIEEETRRLKDIPCLQFGRINTVKIVILSKATYSLNAMSIKVPMSF